MFLWIQITEKGTASSDHNLTVETGGHRQIWQERIQRKQTVPVLATIRGRDRTTLPAILQPV